MKKITCIILLAIQALFCLAGSTPTSITDSLSAQLETLPHDSTRLQLLDRLARISQSSPDALKYAGQLFREAKEQNNDYYICNGAYLHILHYYNDEGELDSIAKWVNILKPVAQNSKYWEIYFNAQKLLINIYIYKKEYEYAFSEAMQMMEKATANNSLNGELASYQCLANIYHKTNRWKEEEKVLKKAYNLLPQIDRLGSQLNILFQLISFNKQRRNYADLKKYLDEAKGVMNEMIHQNPEMKEALSGQYLYLEIYYTYLYLGIDNPALAKEHYEKGQTYITPQTHLPYWLTYQNLGIEYFLYMKEYDAALALADSAMHFVRQYDFEESDYAREVNYKADALKAMGRYTEALPLYEKANLMQDSITNAVSNQQLEEIKDRYHLNQLQLEQAKLRSYIQLIILVVVGVVLILCVSYMLRINRIRKALQLSEKETKEATRKTEEANEMKNRFLSNMSHAIRVPLNNVVGFSQLMAVDTEIDEEMRKEYSDIIQQNTEALMLLVNNVLDLSRLEANMMKYQLMDYDVVQICNDAISAALMQNPNLSIHFQNNVEQHIIHTDCNRIMQMIISTLTGTSATSQEKREIHFSLEKSGEILCFKVVNSPLADSKYDGQEASLRHDINRLLLKHFGGTYQVMPDTAAGPTLLFTYPAIDPQ